jgi:hypothetical protein
MATLDDAIDALLAHKEWMEEHYAELLAACHTELEKAAVKNSYIQAQEQWSTAETKNLVINDAQIGGLIDQLTKVRKNLEDELANLAGVAGILNKLASGVEAGAKIVLLLG